MPDVIPRRGRDFSLLCWVQTLFNEYQNSFLRKKTAEA
jgi:hypothetical protein